MKTFLVVEVMFAAIVVFFMEAIFVTLKTNKCIEKRRHGELAAVRLTKNKAMRIIVDYFYPLGSQRRMLSFDWDDEDNVRENFLCFARINLRNLKELHKMQELLGDVPLNIGYPYNIGEILQQAVRYP